MLSMTFATFAANNLLEGMDPGVNEGTMNWRLMTKGNPHSIISNDAGIDGSGALLISSPNGEDTAGFFAKRFVPVVGGRKYTVEARFKGYVKSGHAFIAARLWTGTKGRGQLPESRFVVAFESPPITECSPSIWSSVHLTFETPKEITGLHIQIAGKDFCGEIAFDDIAVYEMDDTISIPQLSQPPIIDGKLDENFMKEATRFTDFMKFPIINGKLAAEQTKAYVGMTTENIYVAFVLHHKKDRMLEVEMHPRDKSVFLEDSIEFFITPMGNFNSSCHIAINAAGAIYDARDGNSNWNSGIKVATGKLDDCRHLIEFRLPLKDIGYDHNVDAGVVPLEFKMSFARNSNYIETERNSSWCAVTSKFEEPESFRRFKGLGTDFGRNCSDRFWRRDNARSISTNSGIVSWQLEHPIYEELITDKKNPYHGESAYIWPRPLEPINVKFGLQYGVAYSKAEIIEEYKKHGLHPFNRINELKQIDEWKRKTGIGYCLYFPYYIKDFAAPYNPLVYKEMFNETRKVLDQYPDSIWGISLGDEAYEWLLYHFIDDANAEKKLTASPELREAVKTVKEQYGFGKYGVPKSSRGGNGERFEWLATKNYMYARTHEMQRDLYKLCQEYKYHGKPLVCISGDPMGGLNIVQQQSRDRNYCDIFTGQVVPAASRWRQDFCFSTKILKDFTGKTVWPCAHVEPYYRSNDSKTTAAYISEVARGGGSGLQIWNYDLANSRKQMGDTCFDYYGHRPRWETIMDIVDKFRTMGELRFPKDEMAIFFSNDTFSCFRSPPCDASEALFTFAGPSAGAWFKFICGVQLRDNDIRLNDWKVIMFANADVEYVGNQKAFLEYVKNGGTLVCFDAKAFSFNEDGTPTDANREALFGVKTVEKNIFTGFRFVDDALSKGISPDALYNISSKYVLEPMDGTRVLAKFESGEIAATIKDYPGGGRAVLFAFAPNSLLMSSLPWREMMKQFIANLGIATDQDIWRFQFPYKEEKMPEFKDICLTGNFFHWFLNEPVKTANAKDVNGSYSYTLPPDGDAADRKYVFGEGNLCNRFKALEIGDFYTRHNSQLIKEGKIATTMFFDTWSKTDAFDIIVNLGDAREIHSIKLFYSGQLPSLTATLENGSAVNATGIDTEEVAMIELKANGKSKNVKLAIPARTAGKKLILSEMEIWGI